MKVLLCHNTYQIKGGEDTVVNAELTLLQKKGHDVFLHQVSNDEISTFGDKIKVGINVGYSTKAKNDLLKKLNVIQPNIVHIHNFFPLLTPSIYDACKELNIPVIQTLHNYRTICAGALLMRDNKVCELCIKKDNPYIGVLHRCYRHSFIQSFALSRMISQHKKNNTWSQKVDRFITLTEFSKTKFIEAGFPEEKLIVKPNFITDPCSKTCDDIPPFALFVGRISEEKGVQTLCDAFSAINIPLKIVGDGPLRKNLEKTFSSSKIEFLGHRSQNEIYQLMSQAQFMIMPSVWYEGFPMVLLEAFAHRLPILASNIGSLSEIIHHNKTGLLFSPGSTIELAEKAKMLFENPKTCKKLGFNARENFLGKYTDEINYHQLINIYDQAING